MPTEHPHTLCWASFYSGVRPAHQCACCLPACLPACMHALLQDAVIIGARLDTEASGDSCRLAFYGKLLGQLGQGGPQELQRLQVYKVCGCF